MTKSEHIRPIVSDKPYPVPIELRPLWRICLILICIEQVGGEKRYLSVGKVNILVWMLIRKARWSEYEEFLTGRSEDIPFVSADTATYKAVEFAIAKEFVKLEEGKLHITEAGIEVCGILSRNEVMSEELDFLADFGRKLTDSKIKRITGSLI